MLTSFHSTAGKVCLSPNPLPPSPWLSLQCWSLATRKEESQILWANSPRVYSTPTRSPRWASNQLTNSRNATQRQSRLPSGTSLAWRNTAGTSWRAPVITNRSARWSCTMSPVGSLLRMQRGGWVRSGIMLSPIRSLCLWVTRPIWKTGGWWRRRRAESLLVSFTS